MKPKILCIMQLPPPVHGQSIVNKTIAESNVINSNFDLNIINLQFAKLENIGKFTFYKVWKMIYYFFIIVFKLVSINYKAVYFTISPVGSAFYRDCFYVAVLKMFRKKIIYHLHGKGINNKCSSWMNRFLYDFVFNKSFVIHLSENLFSDLSALSCNYSKYILNNGLCQSDDILSVQNADKKNTEIIYLSNIERTKGVLDLIEACKRLDEFGIDFHLSIVGGVLNSLSIDQLNQIIVESNLECKVTYLGTKYGNEKKQCLNKSDIFAFPTYYANECFPLVILEAMQSGLPVVSTFEGAIPEIVDDGVTGFLVPQKNPEMLAEKLKVLIKDSELRQQMGVAGRKKFLEKYTVDKFENNLLTIFNKIINS